MSSLVVFLVALLWLIPETCIGAWMMKVIINWFAPHVYEGIHVTFLQALALSCIINWCSIRYTKMKDGEKPEKAFSMLFDAHMHKWVTFGLFAIIHAVFF